MSRLLVRLSIAMLALVAVTGKPAGAAQTAPLRIEQIFNREPLIGRLPAAITWSPDGSKFLYTLTGGEAGPRDTYLYDVRRRHARVFFRAAPNGKGSRPAPEFIWSPDSRRLAYLDAGNLWVVAAEGTARAQLAVNADDPQWSPDSTRVAYVQADDLYAIRWQGGAPVRYSRDGSADVANGDPDWAYSEELDMRHAYRWSPNGKQIAYLQFDQRPIAPFPIVDFLKPENTVAEQRYPLAGGRNSTVSLRVAAAGGRYQTLYSTKNAGDYLASVGWTPSGDVAATLIDRPQKHLRYVRFGRGGVLDTLIAERDACWVDFHGAPQWLPDRVHVVFISDRDGQESLYRMDTKTRTVVRLTRGFTVTALAGIDAKRDAAFVEAAYPTRRDSTVLRIPLSGGAVRPLAAGAGEHRFTFAPNAREFVRSDAAFDRPPVYSIGSTAGAPSQPFMRAASLTGRHFGVTTLLHIASPAGPLDAWMIKPPDFDPAKRYPVITYVYGGPASPTTADAWDGEFYLYHQALAQRGYIVFSVDGPGSQIDSARAVRLLYHRLGPASLAGQLSGAAYLRTLPYVDPHRIGIWGWSFGGYETTYAMTHAPGVWKVGVAVAPVTDWRFYDSIYTERYMGTPQSNVAAYHASSSIAAAANLRGRLLVSHGTGDDNVHIANSVSLMQALLLVGKQVDFMIYPRKTHSIAGIAQRRHLFNHMLDYWRNL